ncbi:nitrogen regulation protein NR(II) [Acidiferrobacter thiooxydans]|uniref:Sensory histidine kinase/phosphatase NtrB n=1 Tax=Acidiferrobacter thiooxydans TaxID=163359 RepID=A0A368HN72_9GAMM|nr:nitrogen regulation protein NR(II) [Acidiferrobacter thiooxydans]RCN59475.1 PAS domain-containing sensor histidine kinase [Acidiferrobacter thiooxydans]UEO00084.1 PAS domain-containing protein [Acidiferrobacter thiooxydans]
MESHAESIVENLTTAVVVADAALRVRAVNPAGEILFELSAKQMVGQPLERLWPQTAPLAGLFADILQSAHSFTRRGLPLPLPGREVLVDVTATAILPSSESGLQEAALLFELNQVDRLRRLAHEEELVDRHLAQRAVVRGLAHEIKNPLGGLRGAAQLLERKLSESEREYTRIIIREADRLQGLVDRLAGPTRPYLPVQVNIHQVLEHVRSLILAEVGEGYVLRRDYDPSIPEFAGDPDQLVQAVLNLARNAVQAPSHLIILRSRIERQFTIGQRRHKLVLRAEVEDDGPGVPQALRDTLFYPMVTGHAAGTGLGLSIAQDIARRHGGLIEYTSRPARTVFTLFLPLRQEYDPTG